VQQANEQIVGDQLVLLVAHRGVLEARQRRLGIAGLQLVDASRERPFTPRGEHAGGGSLRLCRHGGRLGELRRTRRGRTAAGRTLLDVAQTGAGRGSGSRVAPRTLGVAVTAAADRPADAALRQVDPEAAAKVDALAIPIAYSLASKRIFSAGVLRSGLWTGQVWLRRRLGESRGSRAPREPSAVRDVQACKDPTGGASPGPRLFIWPPTLLSSQMLDLRPTLGRKAHHLGVSSLIVELARRAHGTEEDELALVVGRKARHLSLSAGTQTRWHSSHWRISATGSALMPQNHPIIWPLVAQ
jgi:hypothetical protein